MSSASADQRLRPARLDTWKSIAQHLGRSSRTVQRWHSAYGLPVHHLSGEAGSVYAYADDLDAWLRSRGRQASTAGLHEVFPVKMPVPGAEHSFSDRQSGVADSSLISARAKAQSAQLVALAATRWDSFSHRNLTAILNHYRDAIDLNPGNAAAYAGLSLGLIAQAICGLVSPPVAYAPAKAAAESALAIAPELLLAKCAGAWLAMISTRDWAAAERDFDDLLLQNPSCARTLNGRGLLHVAEGYLKQASEQFLNAARQSPLSSSSMPLYCWNEYLSGEFAYALHRVEEVRATGRSGPVLDAVEALASIQLEDREARMPRIEALAAESPGNDVVRGVLGYAYALRGQEQKARRILESLTHRAKSRLSHEPYGIALILVALNDRQNAVACLEQSWEAGSLWSLGFRSDPALAPLRNDPHYLHFLNRCHYPEFEAPRLRAAY